MIGPLAQRRAGVVTRRARSTVAFLDLAQLHAELREPLDRAWRTVLGHGRFVGGPEVDAFEAEFARYCGVRQLRRASRTARTRSSSSSPALGIGPGDEVIVPTNTFVATAEAVVRGRRHGPGSSTCCPDTLLIDPDAVAAAVGPAHGCGHRRAPVRADGGHRRTVGARRPARAGAGRGRRQAHGARFAGRRAGSWGVAGSVQLLPRQEPGRPRRRWGGGVERPRADRRHPPARGPRAVARWTGTRTRSPAATAGSTRLQAALLEVKLSETGRGERGPGCGGPALPRGAAARGACRWPCTRPRSRCTTSPSSRCPTGQPSRRALDDARDRLGCALPRALPPAAGVRRVRHRAVAGGRGRRRPHPVAAALPDADSGTGG